MTFLRLIRRELKSRQKQGTAPIEILGTHKTLDFTDDYAVFSLRKRVVVGDGFEPSKA
jgi:hypothetical protein